MMRNFSGTSSDFQRTTWQRDGQEISSVSRVSLQWSLKYCSMFIYSHSVKCSIFGDSSLWSGSWLVTENLSIKQRWQNQSLSVSPLLVIWPWNISVGSATTRLWTGWPGNQDSVSGTENCLSIFHRVFVDSGSHPTFYSTSTGSITWGRREWACWPFTSIRCWGINKWSCISALC